MSLVLIIMGAASIAAAEEFPINYDESKVASYTLPDPLRTESGATVGTPEQWRETRRPEVLESFRSHVYGRSPGRPQGMHFELREKDERGLGGKAVRKQVRVYFAKGKKQPWMDILIYLPKQDGPVPVFLGMNFHGNHAVTQDPDVFYDLKKIPEVG